MSDLTADDIAQLRHHIADHRATCASSCAIIERLLAARVADAERVRSVVRDAVHAAWPESKFGGNAPDAIAARVAEQLAGAGVGLSAEERNHLLSIRSAIAGTIPTGSWLWKAEFATIDRLLASPPATLARVVAAGAERFDARPIERASVEARRELAARDRTTAALCALLDSDMPAGDLRKALAELVGRR